MAGGIEMCSAVEGGEETGLYPSSAVEKFALSLQEKTSLMQLRVFVRAAMIGTLGNSLDYFYNRMNLKNYFWFVTSNWHFSPFEEPKNLV